MEKFTFEPDLALATTIPSSWYVDPARFDLENDRIFRRTWQLVGGVDKLQNPGDFFTCEVAGEPLLITRAQDGSINAFYNVCRHRAGPVALGEGNRKSLQCRYHGWTYSLRGQLLAVPEFQGVRCFDKAEHGLVPVRVEVWGPLVFVNLDRECRELSHTLGAIHVEDVRASIVETRLYKQVRYEVESNWKVYIDNFLEGYHIPHVHPEMYQDVDYGESFHIEMSLLSSRQYTIYRRMPGSANGGPQDAAAEFSIHYWIFPGLILNLYPDHLQINAVIPLGPTRTLVLFEWYVADEKRAALDLRFADYFAFSDRLQKQDAAMCELVQKGLHSRSYDRGRLSASREAAVHHFHGLLYDFLK